MERIRILVISFASFFVAVVLTWALPGFPAFSFAATLVSFIYANLHDEERSLVFGFITGLFLDFLTQELPGINALALALTSVTTSRLKAVFLRISCLVFHVRDSELHRSFAFRFDCSRRNRRDAPCNYRPACICIGCFMDGHNRNFLFHGA